MKFIGVKRTKKLKTNFTAFVKVITKVLSCSQKLRESECEEMDDFDLTVANNTPSYLMAPQFSALPPVRVVFSITMEGSARKVVTVRSALMVKNRLDVPMEVRLDSPSAPDSKTLLNFPSTVGSFILSTIQSTTDLSYFLIMFYCM